MNTVEIMPFTVWTLALLGFVFLAAEMLVGAPLWSLLHIRRTPWK
ncbi:hypothetical protein [Acidithiobacillus ferriphilus]|nr:hypothetical protein [Acidithiobacillus ferriphilus]